LFSSVETVVADEPAVRPVLTEHGLDIGTTDAVLAVGVVLNQVVGRIAVDGGQLPEPCPLWQAAGRSALAPVHCPDEPPPLALPPLVGASGLASAVPAVVRRRVAVKKVAVMVRAKGMAVS
jgi:hypothetical protein